MAKTKASDVWDQDSLAGEEVPTFVRRATNQNGKQATKVEVVRDDWDDEDDEEDEGEQEGNINAENATHRNGGGTKNDAAGSGLRSLKTEEDNTTIWVEANKRAPMPELIVAAASTGQSLPPPPPAALQPTLRILKRPSNTNTRPNNAGATPSVPLTSPSPRSDSGSGTTSPPPRGTLAEREAQYQEARIRIFGDKGRAGNANSGSVSRTSSSSGGVAIVRDPLGPEPEAETVGGHEKAHGQGQPAKGFGERRRRRKQ